MNYTANAIGRYLPALLYLLFFTSCYTFSGISIPEGVERAYVPVFEDNAVTGPPPTLYLEITERLRDKVRDEARLLITEDRPDIQLKGTLVDYRVSAAGARAGDQTAAYAAQNQLTITIAIEYTDLRTPDGDTWKQNFSHFFAFDATTTLAAVEDEAIDFILEQINEQVFNRAFAEDW